MARKKKSKGGLTKKGVVAEITTNDLNKDASVVVRHGPKPKKDKDGFLGKFPPTTDLKIPKDRVSSLKIGQSVEVGIVEGSMPGPRTMRV